MLLLRPLPAFTDNYIWTLSGNGGKTVVVDPGEAGPVLAAAAEGFVPVAILLTHHHPDHIGGTAELLRHFDVPCYAPVDDRIVEATHRVGDGDRVRIGELSAEFEVLAIPGHTLSHIAYHGEGILFCGDTLFSLGCGRLFEGTPGQMLSSLDRLAALPDHTLVACGHEYTLSNGRFSQLAELVNPARDARLAEVAELRREGLPSLPISLQSERACNPFLRIDQPAIRQVLQSRGWQGNDRVQAFAALRSWKDGFAA
jgi:hydroxyacylglutathione hydrolase